MKIRTEHGRGKLRNAIQMMRNHCDEAERQFRHEDLSDLELANLVIHSLTWGHANAMSQVETCIANYQREVEMAMIKMEGKANGQ